MTLFSDSKAIWWAGVQAVQPATLISDWLKQQPALAKQPIPVLAVGKAATAMAQAVGKLVPISHGLVITKHGHEAPVPGFEIMAADHPIPGPASVQAAEAVQRFVENCRQAPEVLFLLSGGASALLGDLPPSISLEDWQWLNRALLANGLPIDAINQCRRALGTLKGGKLLAMLQPITVTTLAISDVVGDDPATIGSGPTVVTPAISQMEAEALIKRVFPVACPQQYRLEPLLRQSLLSPPPPDGNGRFHMLGCAQVALLRAAAQAQQLGYQTEIQETPLYREVADEVRRIEDVLQKAVSKPTCYLFWGEPVMTLPPTAGLGGRNQHTALLLAAHLDNRFTWHVLAGGTDGTDGPTDAAGGWADNHTAQKARMLHLDIDQALGAADSYRALQTLHQLWMTGPTQTNVMDLVVALRMP